ncbi:hypothetical protein J7E25_09625 [Agromyces sp. ISL-38]|uniref:hypothetical protein n=1 Tax=Agromyces sp. ISL-38 TaxID=2819107 RepID=UPI001BE75BB1|nr:hypothetical protein [Agromyces sp. ISL-38]MBT2499358.1 hypothetical protein [Agromyces sp. ISL-38]
MTIDEYLEFNPRLDRERLIGEIRSDQRGEDAMVARARGATLLDGALEFELFLERSRRLSTWPGVRRLTRDEVFADHDREAVDQAKLRARALLDDAERYGEELRSQESRQDLGKPSDRERDVRAEMRTEHPGFSDRSYSAVLNRGLFLTR